jgi:hypothetical protein
MDLLGGIADGSTMIIRSMSILPMILAMDPRVVGWPHPTTKSVEARPEIMENN